VQHPLLAIPDGSRLLCFLLLLIASAVLFFIISVLLRPSSSPNDILRLELAGSLERARTILGRWGRRGVQRARYGVYVDFFFLIVYSTTIGLACISVADAAWSPASSLASIGVILALGLWAAALLDAIENIALLKILQGSDATYWPPIAQWCAIPKFTLILTGVIYVVVACFFWAV
jgi:hypothetical protein